MLSALIFLPLGGVIALLVWRRATDTQIRTVALVTTLVTFAISLAVVATFDRSVPGFQHVQDVSWVRSLNLRYIVGVGVPFHRDPVPVLPRRVGARSTDVRPPHVADRSAPGGDGAMVVRGVPRSVRREGPARAAAHVVARRVHRVTDQRAGAARGHPP